MKTKEQQKEIEKIGSALIAQANTAIQAGNSREVDAIWNSLGNETIPVGWVSTAILDNAAAAGIIIESHIDYCAGYHRRYRTGWAKPDAQLKLAKKHGCLPNKLVGAF